MICPRCSVSEIGAGGACELCGYVPATGTVALDVPLPDATDELARDQLAHQFRIDVLLGQGERSAVYLAREAESNRHIVLKVLPRQAGRQDIDTRFRDAIAIVTTFDHPHLVPVLRHGETDSLLWYSMEHRRARPLREMLRDGGRLEYRACMRIVTQIAGALDYLHRRGATHGRLKPENVLVDSAQWVHLCDAMVARAIFGGPGGGGAAPRSPYVAPEDGAHGFVGPASDQYALAALIHEMFTGAPPAVAAPGAEPPPTLAELRPDLPVHVGHAVARALSPRPNDRYPGILDFVTALESGASLLVDARPSGRASDLILTIPGWEPPKQDRPKWLVPLLVGGGAIGIAAAALLLLHRTPVRPVWRELNVPPVTRGAAPASDSSGTGTPPVVPIAPEPTVGEQARRNQRVAPGVVDLRAGREPRARRTPAASSPDATPQPRESAAPAAPVAAPAAPAPAPAAGEPGRLFVNASPWGQLFVDGQLVGNTPKANLQVAAGTHTIRVARDGFEPVERTIRVGAGETVRLTDLVLTPRP